MDFISSTEGGRLIRQGTWTWVSKGTLSSYLSQAGAAIRRPSSAVHTHTRTESEGERQRGLGSCSSLM